MLGRGQALAYKTLSISPRFTSGVQACHHHHPRQQKREQLGFPIHSRSTITKQVSTPKEPSAVLLMYPAIMQHMKIQLDPNLWQTRGKLSQHPASLGFLIVIYHKRPNQLVAKE